MKTVKIDFKFEIGDVVTSCITQSTNRPYLVVERLYRECSGGGQKIYSIRNFTAMVTDTYMTVNEIEMQLYKEVK